MAKMCIICGKEVEGGTPVEDTPTIRFLRSIKTKLKVAANNRLVVCPADLEEHGKKRKGFERKLILYSAAAAILVLLAIVLPIFAGSPIQIVSIIMILVLGLFLVGLAMLSYMPPIEGGAKAAAELAQQSNAAGGKAAAEAHKDSGKSAGEGAHGQHGMGADAHEQKNEAAPAHEAGGALAAPKKAKIPPHARKKSGRKNSKASAKRKRHARARK